MTKPNHPNAVENFFGTGCIIKVEDGVWTFEHEFVKKLLISNVYLQEIPICCIEVVFS